MYNRSFQEKMWRGSIRREVNRHMDKNSLVICDALNYVKGYRYELFTLAKNSKSTYAVLFVNAEAETCKMLNEKEQK